MSTKAIDWKTNYRAVFGSITETQAEAWVTYCCENLEGLKPGEMDKAVAILCDTWPQDSKANPRVTSICRVIRQQRLQARGFDTSKPFEVRQAEAVLQRTENDGTLTRWEIVCQMTAHRSAGRHATDWTPHVFAFALSHGGCAVPYWASHASRTASRQVVDWDTYIACLPEQLRGCYERMGPGSAIRKGASALAFEGRTENDGADRSEPR